MADPLHAEVPAAESSLRGDAAVPLPGSLISAAGPGKTSTFNYVHVATATEFESSPKSTNLLEATAISLPDLHFPPFSTSTPPRSPQTAQPTEREPSTPSCISCWDSLHAPTLHYRAPCGHSYCADCLAHHFDHALINTHDYPRRCCGMITSWAAARKLLPADFVQRFEAGLEELETPAASRTTYCVRCTTFLPTRSCAPSTSVRCRVCRARACTLCKELAHPGECPTDPFIEEILEGRSRCGNCGWVIELRIGCYHIRCRCGASWCFLCGRRWRTCRCPRYPLRRE